MSFNLGANTIIKENVLVKETISLLDMKFPVAEWANTEFEGEIKKQGDTVSVQQFPRIAFTTGTTAGADIDATTFAITKATLVADTLMQVRVPVTNLEEVQSNLNLREELAREIMYDMRKKIDGFISYKAMSGADTGNKLHDAWPGAAVTKSNIFAAIEEMRVALDNNNAFEQAALFVTPSIASLIRQAPEFDGFKEGLEARIDGYVGKMSGFLIYKTNNLSLSARMLGMDRKSVHFACQWTGYDERKEPKGFTDNILSEFVMGASVLGNNKYRIVTYRYA